MNSVATPAREAYHIIRLGNSNAFYLLAERQSLGIAAGVFLLNSQRRLVVIFN